MKGPLGSVYVHKHICVYIDICMILVYIYIDMCIYI